MDKLRGVLFGVLLFTVTSFASRTGTVAGFVRDKASGEFIASAAVYLKDRSAGMSTIRDGYYVLSKLPTGKHTLICTMIGYKEQKIEINIKSGTRIRHDFHLVRNPVGMKAVEVSGDRARFEHEVDIGVQRMDFTQFQQIPGLVEQDLFRSLQMLPGVVSVSDFSSALYIRGGTADQNLVLLDGVTVYNPYHLMGFFSTFILGSLKGAQLYTGGFPARYGSAISSVLDVEMKAGNSERNITGMADIGLLTSKMILEGKLPFGAKGSWLIAGRRTYIDAVTSVIDNVRKKWLKKKDDISWYVPYHFYDLQTKINWDASEKSRFTVSGFFGDDVLKFTDISNRDTSLVHILWGNGTLGLRWRYLFTPELFSVIQFNATRYRINGLLSAHGSAVTTDSVKTTTKTTFNMGLKSGIGELALQWRLSYFPSPEHNIEFGIEEKLTELHNLTNGGNSMKVYNEKDSLIESSEKDTIWTNNKDTLMLAAAYVQYKWQPTPLWVIESGVRGEYFSSGKYWRVAPRLGVKHRITADWAVKAGAGLYYQYLYVPMPRNEMELKLPVRFLQQWTPADSAHKPLQSALFTLGTEYRFPSGFAKDLSLSCEVYYKDMRNIREAISSMNFIGEPDTTPSIDGRGFSYGAEAMVKYRSSWISYAYSVTKYKFGKEDWFYPLHDSRNNVNISLSLPLGKGWNITSAWVFSSGFPFTGAVGWYQYVNRYGEINLKKISGKRGEVRYPPYHRLDAGFTKSFKMFKGAVDAEFYFQVLNVYARKNVLSFSYHVDDDGITRREAQYMLPFPIPSFGIRGRF